MTEKRKDYISWDEHFMGVAKLAAMRSKDPNSQVGCCIVSTDNKILRVHMASIGHPLAGDPVYGPQKVIKELKGQCLHAGCLGFIHPATGEYMEFRSELPRYFEAFLDKLRRSENV